ncbi:helix-turn-helix transcriptional regulator [Enterobacter ludwigii]|uniref:helix-turn-helix domain-containing protein n=1 Tax=Enterobacter ludwigii TaxID=299767 RepID=UPI00159C2672|nr:AraC family transcriptional regulator [Enterobacter ludwigii]QLA06935.1 helix-turn-helix transcriptional regulator [Enterobacter ludwigii]
MQDYTVNYINSVVNLIIAWIELNLSKPIKVKDVVARSGYSEYYLQRSFRVCTGESIAHYVRRRKLKYAAEILTNSDLAIIDLAFNMGFDDVSTFYRSFRREFGVAPGKYRERHKPVSQTGGQELQQKC